MILKKVWGGILIILCVLVITGVAIWYYMTFSSNSTPSRGVFVINNIDGQYGGIDNESLYKAL